MSICQIQKLRNNIKHKCILFPYVSVNQLQIKQNKQYISQWGRKQPRFFQNTYLLCLILPVALGFQFLGPAEIKMFNVHFTAQAESG
jgi:hypothetical protein